MERGREEGLVGVEAIAVAAQDVWTQGGGAFIGKISAEMFKNLGAKWTLTGR